MSEEEKELQSRIRNLENKLEVSVEKLNRVRQEIPAHVEDVLFSHLQSKTPPHPSSKDATAAAASQRALITTLLQSGLFQGGADATRHYEKGLYSHEQAALLLKRFHNCSDEVAALSATMPKRLLNLKSVRTYLEQQQPLTDVEQMLLASDTLDAPLTSFSAAAVKRKAPDAVDQVQSVAKVQRPLFR